MALKTCPKCSERYSDTYRHCPFCEEERAIARGKPIRRDKKRRRQVSRQLPLLLLVALIGGGVWFGVNRGPALYESLVKRYEEKRTEEAQQILAEEEARAAEEARLAEEQAKAEAEAKAAAEAEAKAQAEAEAQAAAEAAQQTEPESEPEPEPEPEPAPSGPSYADAVALPHTLTLNSDDETLFSAGEQLTLRASGGTGSYTWISENESIVTVSENGMLTAIGGGTTHVVVTDGSESAVCIVRVRGPAASGASSGSESAPEGGSSALSLNHSDFTIHLGESGVQLRVQGTDETPSFESADPEVASVSDGGYVRAVGRGVTTVTASVGGQTLKCVVRVSS